MPQTLARCGKILAQIGIIRHRARAAPVIEHKPARKSIHIVRVMTDNHGGNGQVGHQFEQFFTQALAQQGVKRGKRFVKQQKQGVGIERPRQSRALPLPAGYLRGQVGSQMPDAQTFQHGLRLVALLAAHLPGPAASARIGHVLQQAQVWKQGVILKHVADTPLLHRNKHALCIIVQGAVANADMACVRPCQPRQTLHGQRLAGTGRAKKHRALVLVADIVAHVQIEGRNPVPETFYQPQRDHQRRLLSFTSSSAAISRVTHTAEVTNTSQEAWRSLPA